MRSNKSYEEDISESPFLHDKSKKTYLATMHSILTATNQPNIHQLLYNPDTYGPILESTTQSEETLRTRLVTILAFLKYTELKWKSPDIFHKWYGYFLKARKKINKRIIEHEPTERQKAAHVDWEVIKANVKQMEPGTPEHLLMCMITMIPPRRQMDWYQVRLYNSPDRKWKPTEADHNYINLNHETPYILLTHYKTAFAFGAWYKKLPDSLLKVIKASLENEPRDYVFMTPKGNTYTESNFQKWTNGIIKDVTGNPHASMNMMRHSFTIYARTKFPRMRYKDALSLSKDMGHSMLQNLGYDIGKHDDIGDLWKD